MMEGCTMDFEAIKKAAQGYEADMTRFLRDLIAIPSESCEEEGVISEIFPLRGFYGTVAYLDPTSNRATNFNTPVAIPIK